MDPSCQTQYWRLYLLTLVLGIGGSFQYGIHVSIMASPAEAFIIDRVGRKKLMGYGYLLMGIVMSVLIGMLTIKDQYDWVPYVNIALIFSIICVYGLGPSGVSMCLPADLFLQAWRPSAYVVSGTVNWLSLFLISMLFPYIVEGLGQYCFLIFVAYCIFSAAFMLYFIPETKGKTMVEITEDFNKLNFKNRGTDIANGDVLATQL
ncbi:solute carrier family 2, facilitated glucose transporter member 9-like [Engraulis encrasicolus]|uniref:solute carrier family 2, facilitated glucose transporter member 9-like n=1 Tax=Engraulis encrasicolus TaxID=184585 RepID=UPI002FD4B8D6